MQVLPWGSGLSTVALAAAKPPSSISATGRGRMANAIQGKSSEHGLNLSGS